MSFFGVTLETIATSVKHPEADRLSLCTLEGMSYQFITGLNQYAPGDKVYYFPLDSIIPKLLLEQLGLYGKLGGRDKDRVRTIKLRGHISQGIVASFSCIQDYIEKQGLTELIKTTQDLGFVLGVIKYEPEIKDSGGGVQGYRVTIKTLPETVFFYDLEGAQRNKHAVEQLQTGEVYVSEKVEGSCHACGFQYKHINGIFEKKYYVCSHNKNLELTEEDPESKHPFWEVAKNQGLLEFASKLGDLLLTQEEGQYISIYGEFIGPKVQRNIYHLKSAQVRVFDILVNGRWLASADFIKFTTMFGVQTVPVLGFNVTLEKYLGNQTIEDASNGKSALYDTLREGIVIKPMIEQYCHQLHGRLVLKQRSPNYLVKES